MTIKAYWWKGDGNNFGDVISPIILKQLTGQKIVYSEEENSFCSIGSLAYFNFNSKKTFWGSGVISREHKSKLVREHNFLAVRGPKSRKKIIEDGGECPEVYGDPGVLLPILFPKKDFNISKRYKISIFPHWMDYKHVKTFPIVKNSHVNVIDIRQDYLDVIKDAISSDFLICSSLHALILGEAYGIPSIFCAFGNKLVGGSFKFEDYFNSTGRELIGLDHRYKRDDLDLSSCHKTYEKMKKPKIELKKFIDSFPFDITHKKVLSLAEEA